jgi:SAM-dependent methyltransferase
MRCGLATYAEPPSASLVAGWYGPQYSLNALGQDADPFAAARAANFAAWLTNQWGTRPPPASVFEIGCGNATLLRELRMLWPRTKFCGIEPAPAAAAQALAAGFEVLTGHFPITKPSPHSADLVLSLNVIEHVIDPATFLLAARESMAPNGVGFIVCPDGDRANVDLLFADHLYSFTADAFAHVAKHAGLTVGGVESAPDNIGTFALHSIEPFIGKAERSCDLNRKSVLPLFHDRVRLLDQWRNLDHRLAARLGGAQEVTAFGVGEAATMLRAYAPSSWSKVKRCTADVVVRDHLGDVPVVEYKHLRKCHGGLLLLAVNSTSQRHLAARLAADGWRVITWVDLVCLENAKHEQEGA